MNIDEDTKLFEIWRSFSKDALPALTVKQKSWAMLGFFGASAVMLRMASHLNDPDQFVDRMSQLQRWGTEAEDFISFLSAEATDIEARESLAQGEEKFNA